MSGQIDEGTRDKFRSLTVTLGLAFLILSLMILFVSSSLEMLMYFRAQKKAVADQQRLIAENAADKVRGFIQKKFEELEYVTTIGGLSDIPDQQRKEAFEKMIGLEDSFRRLALFDMER